MYALVSQIPGAVSKISPTLADNKDHAELGGQWYPCGEAVEIGWLFNGNSFMPSPDALKPEPGRAAEEVDPQVKLVQSAMTELAQSDVTVIRYVSAGVAITPELHNYRNALRAIVNGTDKDTKLLPSAPTNHPKGT